MKVNLSGSCHLAIITDELCVEMDKLVTVWMTNLMMFTVFFLIKLFYLFKRPNFHCSKDQRAIWADQKCYYCKVWEFCKDLDIPASSPNFIKSQIWYLWNSQELSRMCWKMKSDQENLCVPLFLIISYHYSLFFYIFKTILILQYIISVLAIIGECIFFH